MMRLVVARVNGRILRGFRECACSRNFGRNQFRNFEYFIFRVSKNYFGWCALVGYIFCLWCEKLGKHEKSRTTKTRKIRIFFSRKFTENAWWKNSWKIFYKIKTSLSWGFFNTFPFHPFLDLALAFRVFLFQYQQSMLLLWGTFLR